MRKNFKRPEGNQEKYCVSYIDREYGQYNVGATTGAMMRSEVFSDWELAQDFYLKKKAENCTPHIFRMNQIFVIA